METATHMLRTGRRGALFQLQTALRDLQNSFGRLGLAWSLATHDVGSRYRGSVLGPFWITLSMALMVLGIGFLYASLFHLPLNEFLPYVAIGIVFFGVMTGVINEGCETFVQAASMLSQTALPMFTFVWRTVFRNLINLAHHLVIVVLVLAFSGWREANVPVAVVGLVLMVANAGWLSMVVGIASARFRDIPQIVISVMQFAFLFTPVFWRPDSRAGLQPILDFNPFYHLLELIRSPLLGSVPPLSTWIIASLTAAITLIAGLISFSLSYRKISLWI